MMFYLSESELLLYGGLLIMSAAVLLAALSIVIFCITGRRIRRKLEEEYGRL